MPSPVNHSSDPTTSLRLARLASLVCTNSIYDRMVPSASALNFLVGEGLLSLALRIAGTDDQQSQQRLEGEGTVLLQVTITAVTPVQAIIDALLGAYLP